MICSTKINLFNDDMNMLRFLLLIFLIGSLFPASIGFSQLTEKPPTLGIELSNTEPFWYKDNDGKTVVIGEVINKKTHPITNVKIGVYFYDQINDNPLEFVTAKTTLDVIPPLGKSSFMVKSNSANSAISYVTAKPFGFFSSEDKYQLLSLEPGEIKIGNDLELSGTITHNGPLNSTNTKIHLLSYDIFEPPRIVGLATIDVDGDLLPGSTTTFEFKTNQDYHASSFKIVAESDGYQSPLTDVKSSVVVIPTKAVIIDGIGITDSNGNELSTSDIIVGTPVNIGSQIRIQHSSGGFENQPYVFYVQIKQFGEPVVEFIGTYEDSFQSSGSNIHSPIVEWTPKNEGGFFIETYVWSIENMPLAKPSPNIVLVLVGS